MAADERTWTTHQLARLSGMSYRQVDHMVRSGVMAPVDVVRSWKRAGSGSARRWSSRQVAVTRALACIGELGADHTVRRPMALALLDAPPSVWSSRVLVTPDGQVRPLAGRAPVVAGWLVDLAQVWADAEQAMAAELDGELALVG